MSSYSHLDTPTKNRIVGYAQLTGNAVEAGRKENVNPHTAQQLNASAKSLPQQDLQQEKKAQVLQPN